MKFTVMWTSKAEEHLANIWIFADDRQAIVAAAARLDAQLATNPLECGESRTENWRIAFEAPLGIDFRVFPENRRVQVLAVWRTDRK